jgi:hypothetical protein
MIQHLPDKIPFNRETLAAPPKSLVDFIGKLLADEYEGPQRRDSQRHAVVMPVAAMPVDDKFQPSGEPFAAITRDLSTAGLRLFSTRATNSEFLAVELTPPSGQTIQVVLKVLRCKAIGRFYEIAGQLIARTDAPPS